MAAQVQNSAVRSSFLKKIKRDRQCHWIDNISYRQSIKTGLKGTGETSNGRRRRNPRLPRRASAPQVKFDAVHWANRDSESG